MMRASRRAMFLIEMLPVLLAIAVGGTLMTISIASILRSQKRVAELSNRYAVLNDFMACLRQDVRTATKLALEDGDGDNSERVLVIDQGSRKIAYRFPDRRVERLGGEQDPVADKSWTFEHTDFDLALEPSPEGLPVLVNVSVWWQRTAPDHPEPGRRFDVTMRCTEMLPYE